MTKQREITSIVQKRREQIRKCKRHNTLFSNKCTCNGWSFVFAESLQHALSLVMAAVTELGFHGNCPLMTTIQVQWRYAFSKQQYSALLSRLFPSQAEGTHNTHSSVNESPHFSTLFSQMFKGIIYNMSVKKIKRNLNTQTDLIRYWLAHQQGFAFILQE